MQQLFQLSEYALSVVLGNDFSANERVLQLLDALKAHPLAGLIEAVPAYSSLTVYYDPAQAESAQIRRHILALLDLPLSPAELAAEAVEIPVCYGMGEDLAELAALKNVPERQLIEWHTQPTYRVYMLGFTPGFAYMGKVLPELATPRKATPRLQVPAGSVGIAELQTGIYPLESPGGWQLIGRTPWRLFNPEWESPCRLSPGMRVKFKAIDQATFKLTQEPLPEMPEEANGGDVVVLKSGAYSTLQDGGRRGYRQYGVPVSGAMDWRAAQAANRLVGNMPNETVLECTMGGLYLQFKTSATIALAGGGKALLNGKWKIFYQPFYVMAGDMLEIKFASNGLRTYLAVSGGFKGRSIMGSESAYPNANLGRLLKNGDMLAYKNPKAPDRPLPADTSFGYAAANSVRIIAGPELDWLAHESVRRLYEQPFSVGMQSNRIGYRLQGEPLTQKAPQTLLSTSVMPGTIQCTPDGQLIVLMNDAQTIGGYPRIAQIASVDLPILAQLKPHDLIKFAPISVEHATALCLM